MVTQDEKDATFHCGIGKLLRIAYKRDFTIQEKGRCKMKFPTFNKWYATLNTNQRQRVKELLEREYGGDA